MIADHFAQAIAAAGLVPPDTIHADGQLYRFSATGKRSDSAGWYVLHADGLPAGVFGCWRTGLTETWCSKAESTLTPAERQMLLEKVRAAQRQRDAEKVLIHQQAGHSAMLRWRFAQPATEHPYLAAKGVKAHGLRMDGRRLLVPLRDTSGTLTSLQTIYPNGSKRLFPGGRVTGCYHAIGTLGCVLVLAEGYATGATIHEATGLPVAVAFNAGNLLAVARTLRRKFPALPIVLAADDDHTTEGNPGLTAARAAALAVGGLVAVPQFPADRPPKATDFNDLFSLAGSNAVRACFAEVMEGLDHGH